MNLQSRYGLEVASDALRAPIEAEVAPLVRAIGEGLQ